MKRENLERPKKDEAFLITGFDVSFGQYIAVDHVFDKGHNTS